MDLSCVPPPVIDSAKLLYFAHNDDEVEFTDRIELFVGQKDDLERLGEMPCLAICVEYANPKQLLLMFCNSEWEPQGVIAFRSIEEAKRKAERGYRGISVKWEESPYTEEELKDYLRDVYDVDPTSEWWTMTCSFCGRNASEVATIMVGKRATICRECVLDFCNGFTEGRDA